VTDDRLPPQDLDTTTAVDIEPHPSVDGCFFCATDAELSAALRGDPHRTLHMSTTEAQCPFWLADDGGSA
jgi:hypothetical protein